MFDYYTLSFIVLFGLKCLCIAKTQCNGTVREIEIGYEGKMFKFPESDVYERNLLCEWLITSSVDERVIFQTRDVQISPGDAYYVYDGRNESGRVLHEMVYTSGSAFSHSLAVTKSSNLFLKFTSDNQSNPSKDHGFAVYIISAGDHSNCTDEVTSLSAGNEPKILTSPSFPDRYKSNADCSWDISADGKNSTIILDVYFLDVEASTTECYDTLTINTGSSSVLCGSDEFLPNKTYSGKGNISVTFRSDRLQNENGFIIAYRKEDDNLDDTTTRFAKMSTNGDVNTDLTAKRVAMQSTNEDVNLDLTTTQVVMTSTNEETTAIQAIPSSETDLYAAKIVESSNEDEHPLLSILHSVNISLEVIAHF